MKERICIILIEISNIEQRAMRWVAFLKETCRFRVEVRMEKSNALSWAPLARHKASGEQNRLNNHGKKLEEGGQRLCGYPGRLMLAWCTHVSVKDIDLKSINLMGKWGSRNPGNITK